MLTIAEIIAFMIFTFDAFNTSTYTFDVIAECSDHPTVDTAQTLVLITYSSLTYDVCLLGNAY